MEKEKYKGTFIKYKKISNQIILVTKCRKMEATCIRTGGTTEKESYIL